MRNPCFLQQRNVFLRTHQHYKAGNVSITKTDTRSRNHGCSGKAISITYAERVFIAFSYPGSKAHATILYCHMWAHRVYSIVPHYPLNGTFFWKTLLTVKCVICFSLQLSSATLLNLSRSEQEIILTHCGRVRQICIFNTVRLGTSASSP